MTSLRLLADDLTGALDAAAEFVPLTGPVQTFWRGAIPAILPPNAALDSVTRERDPATAIAIIGTLIPHLNPGTIAFKKIDSLFRGPTVAELAACLRNGVWTHCVLAPAFPYQGRITRAARQYAATPTGAWCPATDDLVATFRTLNVPAQPGHPGIDPQPGVTVFDAETDADLRRIVAAARRYPHPVLWAGTGGLAQALTAPNAAPHPDAAPPSPPLPQPVIGLFGSDQPATASQLAACAPHWTVLPDGGPASAARIAANLAATGIALASFQLPADTPRDLAAGHIARHIHQLTRTLAPPGTVLIAGGETLRTLCQSLGATSLEVQGRIVPGVPRSIIRGGRWNGVTVVSKSGAFGHPQLLRDLLPIPERRAS